MSSMKMILHATDFSGSSARAFEFACALARDHGARLLVLHVMMPSAASLGPPPPSPWLPAEGQEGVPRFCWPEPAVPGVEIEHRVAEGDAVSEILRLAEREKCDLLVLGTHGRTGLYRWLVGSVAEEVLRRAHCPVITVFETCGQERPVRRAVANAI